MLLIQLGLRFCITFSLNLIPHATGEANKMCLNENCSRVRVGKNFSDMFPIRNILKQGDVYGHCFSTLLLSTPLGGFG